MQLFLRFKGDLTTYFDTVKLFVLLVAFFRGGVL